MAILLALVAFFLWCLRFRRATDRLPFLRSRAGLRFVSVVVAVAIMGIRTSTPYPFVYVLGMAMAFLYSTGRWPQANPFELESGRLEALTGAGIILFASIV
ncbi:MAG TPA: hypothetical protein VGH80_11165 [Xanthomonadaceae bacterium]